MNEPWVGAWPTITYFEGLEAGELRYQHCPSCDAAVFYPRVLCPSCGSDSLQWKVSSGIGTVYSMTVVRASEGPRYVSLIDLDEGFRMMSRVEPDPAAASIGDRVRFSVNRDGDRAVAVFTKEVEL